jgi:hypothetical protein
MNDDDFRDVCAMFAMNGLLAQGFNDYSVARTAYKMADEMLEARNKEPEQEVGIVAAKPRRRKSA